MGMSVCCGLIDRPTVKGAGLGQIKRAVLTKVAAALQPQACIDFALAEDDAPPGRPRLIVAGPHIHIAAVKRGIDLGADITVTPLHQQGARKFCRVVERCSGIGIGALHIEAKCPNTVQIHAHSQSLAHTHIATQTFWRDRSQIIHGRFRFSLRRQLNNTLTFCSCRRVDEIGIAELQGADV